MSQYVIEIDEKKIEEQINRILSDILTRQLDRKYSDCGSVMSDGVKDIIYSHKDEIIEKVVDRASYEIQRKALPKLLNNLTNK